MVNLYSIGALAKHALMHIAFEGKQSPLFPYPVIRGHFPAAPEVAARPLLAARLVEAATPPATGCVGMARRDGELSPADNTRSGIDPIGTVSTIHIALIRAIYLLRLVQWNIKRLLACGANLVHSVSGPVRWYALLALVPWRRVADFAALSRTVYLALVSEIGGPAVLASACNLLHIKPRFMASQYIIPQNRQHVAIAQARMAFWRALRYRLLDPSSSLDIDLDQVAPGQPTLWDYDDAA